METILVTGGAGFIGSNFVRHLLSITEANVVVVDKLTYAGHLKNLASVKTHPRFSFHKVDIGDRETMWAVYSRHQPTAVVNFAAESHVDRSIDGPRPFVETNIVGSFELLETTRRFLADKPPELRGAFRFLHVSTDEVYGSLGRSGAFHETTRYAPTSPYSASKAAADHLVVAYHHSYGLPAIITNCSNNYGPFQFPEKLVPLMILNAIEGKPLPIYGDGLNVRDWLYVEDHCGGILTALQKGRPGERYHIGGGNERTNVEVVDTICDLLERHRPSAQNPALAAAGDKSYKDLKHFVQDRPGHDRRYAIDSSKIRKELGWAPGHSFEEAMAKTVDWYLENLHWCEEIQANNYRRERLGLKG